MAPVAMDGGNLRGLLRSLDDPEHLEFPVDYQAALLEKLTKEAHEARQAPPDQLAAELADALEVL